MDLYGKDCRDAHRVELTMVDEGKPEGLSTEPERSAGHDTGSATAAEINGLRLKRQHDLRIAAQYVTLALCGLPAVRRVVVFGSVARPLEREKPRSASEHRAGIEWTWHYCEDVDLAVWLDDLSDVRSLQQARSRALKLLLDAHGIGVAHHRVDLFLFEPGTDSYLGRVCAYAQCPKGKRDCATPGCGETPFLKQIRDFVLEPDALDPAYSICLYDATGHPAPAQSVLHSLMGEKKRP